MATPSHLTYVVRDLSSFAAHEGLPARGETEDEYFKRLVSEIRRQERADRRQRVIRWLLGREPAPADPPEPPRARSAARVSRRDGVAGR
jgi:hypothetical protein